MAHFFNLAHFVQSEWDKFQNLFNFKQIWGFWPFLAFFYRFRLFFLSFSLVFFIDLPFRSCLSFLHVFSIELYFACFFFVFGRFYRFCAFFLLNSNFACFLVRFCAFFLLNFYFARFVS